VKVEINLKIVLLGILFFILKEFEVYAIFILFIVLHEMAHLIIGMWLGLKPKVFSINPLGVSIEFYMYKSRKSWKKIITYLAGPFLNFVMAVIFLFIPIEEKLKMEIVYTNILLGIFNLVPIMPLDGGKIMKEILLKKIGNKDATIFMNNLTKAILVAFTFIYSILILKIQNFAIFLLIIYLWYLKYIEDKKLKTVLRAYEVVEENLKIY